MLPDPSRTDPAPRESACEQTPPRPRQAPNRRALHRDLLIALAGFLLGSIVVGVQAVIPRFHAGTDARPGSAPA